MHHQHAAQHELPRALGPASPTVHGCALSEYRFRQPHVLTLCFQGLEDGEGGARDVAGNVGFKHFFGCGLYVYGTIGKAEEGVLEGLWNSILWA
jgi:hypothetical protein